MFEFIIKESAKILLALAIPTTIKKIICSAKEIYKMLKKPSEHSQHKHKRRKRKRKKHKRKKKTP